MAQMNQFINEIKKMAKEYNNYSDKAFQSVIDNLFLKNLWGKWKAMGIDEYDSESNTKQTLIPGHIYAFKYKADKPTTYDNGKIKFEYFDRLPIILCLGHKDNIIHAINLNLCSYGLRALILNDLYNMDPDFFRYKASDQSHMGQMPISGTISKFFLTPGNVDKFLQYIKNKYHIQNTGFIFRTYDIKKIQGIRFIETWQWKYIPFIDYKQNVKNSTLQLIQSITGVNKIRI